MLAHSPQIVTNGLVFAYDMANTKKSWKGAPTTNLYADGNFALGTTHPVNGGGAVVADPTVPSLARNVIKFSPSGGNQYHGRDITAVVSTVYSLQMEIYVSADFNGTNVQMYPEQGGAGAAVSYDLTKKGTWQTLRFNNKAATTTNIRMLAYVLSSFTTGFVLATNIQVEQNAFCTPFVNGTRSNTQALVDLTNNNTITATSLTYASDGTFSFNGSSNYAVFPENSALNTQTPTVEVWVKTNATSQNGFWFEKGTVNSQYALFQEGSNIQWRLGPLGDLSTPTATYMNTTNWYQVVGTYTSGDRRLYINGVQVNSNATTGTLSTNTNGSSIGVYGGFNGSRGYYYNGNIASVKVYNRALSAAEVKQNFNALRGRFGI